MIDVTMIMPVCLQTENEDVEARQVSGERDLFAGHFIKENETEKIASQKANNLFASCDAKDNELATLAEELVKEEEVKEDTCQSTGGFPFFFVELPVQFPFFLGEQYEVGELLQSISQQTLMEMEQNNSTKEMEFSYLSESRGPLFSGEIPDEVLLQFPIGSKGMEVSEEDVRFQQLKEMQRFNEEVQVDIIDLQMESSTDEKQGDGEAERSIDTFTQVVPSPETTATTVNYEKVKLNEVANKLQAKIEYLQKFVVKVDKAFIELNPENLGKIDVLMQKNAGKLLIEVSVYEPLAKAEIEMIFEDLQTRLREAAIEFQLSFTEKESKEQTNKEKQKQKTRNNETTSMFAEILEEDNNV